MRQANQTSDLFRPKGLLGLTLLSAAALIGCGGGGGGAPASVPDFEATTVRITATSVPVDAVRDNRTGIVWAAFLGALPPSTGIIPRLPSAAELLHLADTTSDADLRANFPFAFAPLTSKTVFETQEKSNVQPGAVWVVDLGGEALKGAMQSWVSLDATAQWYVLSPGSSAIASRTYNVDPLTGVANSTDGRLSWKVCAEGMTWNSTTTSCDGLPTPMNQQQVGAAIATANDGRGFGRINQWRLPTKQELQSLLVLTNQPPAPLVLPAFNYDLQGRSWATPFMTSSTSTGGLYWSVSFDDGEVNSTADPSMPLHVRLVSGAR